MNKKAVLYGILTSNMRRIVMITMMTVFVTLFSGCSFFLPKEEETLAPPLQHPDKVTYETIEVKKGTIQRTVYCSGYFVSVLQKDVFFRYRGGRLKALYVNKIGDAVKAGDLLAELDNDSLESQIKQQNTALKRAVTSYSQLKAEGKINIEIAGIQLDSLRRKYDNIKDAADSGSKEEMQSLQDQIKQQELNLLKIQNEYGVNENGEKGFALQQAELSIEEAQFRLDELQKELEKSKLVSPVTGEIVYINPVKEGDSIDAYSTVIRIADPTKLQLEYKGEKVPEFKLDMKVAVAIDGKNYEGKVVMTRENLPQDSNDSLRDVVRIEVKNPEGKVSIGTLANITLVLEKKDDTIVLPKNIVSMFGGQRFVYVLENGIRTERVVQLGIESDTEVEIIKGLQVGDKVIVR